MLLATVTALLAVPGPVQAATFVNPFEVVATSATNVIGFGSSGDDGGNACTPVLASHDRGTTFTPGACLANPGQLMLDVTNGAPYALELVYETNGPGVRLVLDRLDTNGAVAQTTDIPGADPSTQSFSAVDGGTLYLLQRSYDDPANAVMHRYPAGGAAGTCGLPPKDVNRFVTMPGGILVAVNSDGGGGPRAISTDACATWKPFPAKPGADEDCTNIHLYSPVRAYVGCFPHSGVGLPTNYALDLAHPTAWQKSPISGLATDFPDQGVSVFVSADERQLHIEGDTYGQPGWPAGWGPTHPQAAGGTAAPAGPAARALAFANARYRRPLGLPDLGWSALAAKAAQNHADYYAKNGYSGHTETPGKPGFTGKDFPARCRAVGIKDCNGEVAFTEPDIVKAVKGWLATPYHGSPIVVLPTFGFGWSKKGSVGDAGSAAVGAYTIDLEAAPNTPGSSLKVWPADGMTKIPTQWWGAERPDPLQYYRGDKNNVGPTFYATSVLPVTFSLRTAAGNAVPLLEAGDTRARATFSTFGPYGRLITYFPAQRLATATHYVLTATVAGKANRFRFTTARQATATA